MDKKSKTGRVVLIVMDSFGVGALPDADRYGDTGADTFGHIADAVPDIRIPNLLELGLGNIEGAAGGRFRRSGIRGMTARLAELSKGKDTITGHWEIAGIYTEIPFKTYPEGFPEKFISEFEKAIGTKTLGNIVASGTEIIESLGDEHEKTGFPIVYTSADSVFQIAADTDIIPLERLYEICSIARSMLKGEVSCGRVIARPYIKKDGKRIRTSDRKDYAVAPPEDTLLDNIKNAGMTVYAIGKISDIFDGMGVTRSVHTKDNNDGVDKTIEALEEDFRGLIFTNLVDFDSKYGHRRDPEGYAGAIEEFDRRLPDIEKHLKDDDILMICADHGNDPSYSGFNHTREYIPLIIYGKVTEDIDEASRDIGTRRSFADIGATIAELLGVKTTAIGTSFAGRIL